MNTCAWCKKEISEHNEVFGFGAKARKGIDIGEHEGSIIQLSLLLSHKKVPAIVTIGDSEAKKAGYDLMFMACCQKCAELLKAALEQEKDLFVNITGFSLN